MSRLLDRRSRSVDLSAYGMHSREAGTVMDDVPSLSSSPLKAVDWLNLHYARVRSPAPWLETAQARRNTRAGTDVGSVGGMERQRGRRDVATEHIPTMAEGSAAAAAVTSGFTPPGYSAAATGLSGALLFASAARGARNFLSAPRSNRADAYALTNIAAGLNTLYTALPLPQWKHASFASATLTAIGAIPTLYQGRTARNYTTRALQTLSGMGYITSAGLAFESDRSASAGESISAAHYANLSNFAWAVGWGLSAVASYLEARTAPNHASQLPDARAPLLESPTSSGARPAPVLDV